MAGLGGFLGIGITGALSVYAGTPLLMAPFGATCVLMFSVPASPLSQPMNIVCGHLLSSAIGFALHMFLPNTWWAVALAAGLAIALMAALRVTHPPAGADPLVVFASDPSLGFLVSPVLLGSILLVLVGTIFHRATRTSYPLKVA
jgi:CBS-domain-containing membrane protein